MPCSKVIISVKMDKGTPCGDDIRLDVGIDDDKKDLRDDVTISVEGQTVVCSKCVLVSESYYFRAMFDSNMVECQTGKVTLHDQKYDIVNTLVQCMNNGELKIAGNVLELLHVAVLLQIKTAIDSCVSYLKKTLDDTNCLGLVKVAQSYVLDDLYSEAKRHSLYFFNRVVIHSEFVELELTDLTSYLSDKHLNCGSEVNVLNSIQTWLDHDQVKRGEKLGDVLQNCFHPEDLLECEWDLVLKHKLLTDTDVGVMDWLQENKQQEKITLCNDQYREVPCMFLTIGGAVSGEYKDEFCKDIYKFDAQQKMFQPFLSIGEVYPEVGLKMGFAATVVGKDLYLTGGQPSLTRSKYETNMWKLDGFNLNWEIVTSLPIPRRHHGACASESSLFLIGGFGRYREILTSFQEYNIEKDEWHDLPSMIEPCYSPGVMYCSGKIYMYKSVLYCYDLHTATWSTFKTCINTEVSVIPATFNNYIYEFPFLNGEFDVGELKCSRTNLRTISQGESENIPYHEEFQFGNSVVTFNRKFYLINNDDCNFVSGNLNNFNNSTILGTQGNAGKNCILLALPCYPDYKVTMTPLGASK